MTDLAPLTSVTRPMGSPMPFEQSTLEASAGKATLKVDGKPVDIILPPASAASGSPAVWSPAGIYSR